MQPTFIENHLCARPMKNAGNAKSNKTWTLLKSFRLDCKLFDGRDLVRIKNKYRYAHI